MALIYDDFAKWLDGVLEKEIPDGVVALSFNIYEDGRRRWSVEVVGTSSFDKDGEDWACDEATDFETRNDPFSWDEKTNWKNVASEVAEAVQKYLEGGRCSDKLKTLRGVATGFVDGDLNLLYVKE